MESSLATLPKVPITGDLAAVDNSSENAEEAVTDVYAKLKASGASKTNSVVEIPMPSVEAIKEADNDITAEGEKILNDSLEAIEQPSNNTPVPNKKSLGLNDPWESEPHAIKNKTIDDVLDQTGAEKIVPTKNEAMPANDSVLVDAKQLAASTAVPTAIPTLVQATSTPTPKATATPKAIVTPTKTNGAGITLGVKEKGWFAQVAAPKTKSEADGLAAKLRSNGFRVSIETANIKGDQYYRILVGPEDNRTQAENLIGQLKRESYLSGAPFIRAIK
jgi:cell division septation protein DedD